MISNFDTIDSGLEFQLIKFLANQYKFTYEVITKPYYGSVIVYESVVNQVSRY